MTERKLQGDRMVALEPMLGVWDCEETYHAGGFTPTESRAKGEDVLRPGPGGHSIIADYVSEGAIGRYEAHDVIHWDEPQGRYVMYFVDSFSPGAQHQTGSLEGGVLTLEHRTDLGFGPGIFRRTYRFSERRQDLFVDFVPDGGAAKRLVTIVKSKR